LTNLFWQNMYDHFHISELLTCQQATLLSYSTVFYQFNILLSYNLTLF